MQVGVDTGGTFTDVVAADGRSTKVLSTPDDPARAVAAGLATLDVRPSLLAHGTTVATNALLERRGSTVALVTTAGLADVVEIGRQDRPSLYDQLADRPEPLVPRHLRFEVLGRLAADGSEIEPLDLSSLPDLTALASPATQGGRSDLSGSAAQGDLGVQGDEAGQGDLGSLPDLGRGVVADGGVDVGAVAVCLLHADLNPGHERAVAEHLRARGLDVVCSHEVSPEMREYERTVTTVINASLRPRIRGYLRRLSDLADEVLVMTSAGGLLPTADAAELPAALLLSGPAGGVRAGAAAAAANGFPDAVTFDMGGTSTDVCLILDGEPVPAAQRDVGGFTVRFPSLDVHTIGAGGGSIARLDAGGALVVGPESAGARPGPACYGLGGTEPTVTDANLVAGRIPAESAFGGLRLDRAAAEAALSDAAITAEGVVAVVNANMERALRAVSVERGVDPRGLALVAFGGAGPLHAAELADALGMSAVIVPSRAGVLSAVGLLTAPRRRDLVRSWPTPSDHTGLADALEALAAEATKLASGGLDAAGLVDDDPGPEVETSVDCHYAGQSHELTVSDVRAFHAEHARRNGYARPEQAVEVIALRATVRRAASVDIDRLPLPDGPPRRPAYGPVVLAEADCTVWVPDGWVARAGAAGAWVLRRRA